ITYTWKVNGTTVASGLGLNTYTPTETNEGGALTVSVSFTDTHGFAETGSKAAGTVQESATDDPVATIDSATATSGVAIHVTAVTDGGLNASGSVTYAWQVSTDGTNWTTEGSASNFTPGSGDVGKQLRLVLTDPSDPSSAETSTYTFGTVQIATESPP